MVGVAGRFIHAHFSGRAGAIHRFPIADGCREQKRKHGVDDLRRLAGGPRVVTQVLRTAGIEGMRVDLGEAEVGHIFDGTVEADFTPEQGTDQAAFLRQQQGCRAYLMDVRSRTAPDATAEFLEKLWSGQLLSAASTKRLIDLTFGHKMPRCLRASLPADISFADKCGTLHSLDGETAADNDVFTIG